MTAEIPAVGDTIVITDRIEGVVTRVEEDSWGTVAHMGVWKYGLATSVDGRTRSWKVTKNAPVPWQAGDIAHTAVGPYIVVRQTDDRWLDFDGAYYGTDLAVDTCCTPIVRGGKRVAG